MRKRLSDEERFTTSAVMLAGIASSRESANAWEVAALQRTVAWLRHVVEERPAERDFVYEMPIAGEGAPGVAEDAVAEFAAAMGLNAHAARSYLADAWDLAWRFPLLREAVSSGAVLVWKARMITAATHHLSAEATEWIDEMVTPTAAKIGPVRLKRLVVEAEALTDPDAAQARADAAAETRRVGFHPRPNPTGVVDVVATLDHADADDLEAAVAQVAAELGRSEETAADSWDVRRAKALGVIARRQLSGWTAGSDQATSRVLHTYVHLTPGTPLARIEKADALVPVRAIQEWCARSGTRVTVTPVLDLAADLTRDGYVPSAQMREQAVVLHQTCVHPFCTRSARVADLDHIEPFDPGGPPGQTASTNLAPLCRLHHRLKTHTEWSYRFLEPGHFLWTSPTGWHYLRTPSGTTILTAGVTVIQKPPEQLPVSVLA